MSRSVILQELQAAKAKVGAGTEAYDLIVPARDEVLARYGAIFKLERIDEITEGDFKSFLLFKNNKHWTGLYRSQARMCADMDVLREGLRTLLDEGKSIGSRYTQAVEMISGMGRGIATAILTVAYPTQYGVWNNTSEEAMRAIGAWPEFKRGLSIGDRYEQINEILNQLARELKVDLWTLDALWHIYLYNAPAPEVEEYVEAEGVVFGLESHLHDFLRDNWENTELGRKWTLEVEPGEPELGYEYPTGVGRIDLLARSKSNNDLLVIELKRWQSSDETAGQILRYMGWVRKHVAQENSTVHGLVIAGSADERLKYALEELPNVEFKRYKIEFELLPDSLDLHNREENSHAT